MDTHTDANVKLLLSPRQSRGITYWIQQEQLARSLGDVVAKRGQWQLPTVGWSVFKMRYFSRERLRFPAEVTSTVIRGLDHGNRFRLS
jgi:hypothetical protein